MQVIKDKKITEIDWKFYEKDNPVLDEGNVIFPFTVFEENRQQLIDRSGKTGVILNGEIPVAAVENDLSSLALIALEFPKFADGRCFSHARILRDTYHYQGEILAFGDMLRDQIAHMLRCGINIIKFPAERDIEDALKAFNEFSIPYQIAADDQKIIDDLR